MEKPIILTKTPVAYFAYLAAHNEFMWARGGISVMEEFPTFRLEVSIVIDTYTAFANRGWVSASHVAEKLQEHKFIVMGSFCEYMAHLHTEAKTKEEARAKWEAVFTEEQKKGLYVTISNCTDEPWMLKHYKVGDNGSDFYHYSGGYQYDY